MAAKKTFSGYQALRCGGCGKDKHRLYRHPENGNLIVVCCGCESATAVTIPYPKIQLDWLSNHDFPDDESDGYLARDL